MSGMVNKFDNDLLSQLRALEGKLFREKLSKFAFESELSQLLRVHEDKPRSMDAMEKLELFEIYKNPVSGFFNLSGEFAEVSMEEDSHSESIETSSRSSATPSSSSTSPPVGGAGAPPAPKSKKVKDTPSKELLTALGRIIRTLDANPNQVLNQSSIKKVRRILQTLKTRDVPLDTSMLNKLETRIGFYSPAPVALASAATHWLIALLEENGISTASDLNERIISQCETPPEPFLPIFRKLIKNSASSPSLEFGSKDGDTVHQYSTEIDAWQSKQDNKMALNILNDLIRGSLFSKSLEEFHRDQERFQERTPTRRQSSDSSPTHEAEKFSSILHRAISRVSKERSISSAAPSRAVSRPISSLPSSVLPPPPYVLEVKISGPMTTYTGLGGTFAYGRCVVVPEIPDSTSAPAVPRSPERSDSTSPQVSVSNLSPVTIPEPFNTKVNILLALASGEIQINRLSDEQMSILRFHRDKTRRFFGSCGKTNSLKCLEALRIVFEQRDKDVNSNSYKTARNKAQVLFKAVIEKSFKQKEFEENTKNQLEQEFLRVI